jgi:hypothetical protein
MFNFYLLIFQILNGEVDFLLTKPISSSLLTTYIYILIYYFNNNNFYKINFIYIRLRHIIRSNLSFI